MSDWRIFTGVGEPHNKIFGLPEPPSWRDFRREFDKCEWSRLSKQLSRRDEERGKNFRIPTNDNDLIDAVNASLYLRKPLLVTGRPGTGKTSLAYRLAYELNLGSVLTWSITAQSKLKDGLYRYDAMSRLEEGQMSSSENKSNLEVGQYVSLGPVGTAMLPTRMENQDGKLTSVPRVLLIDEFDKSDINLPNDLLNLFEEGEFEIPELVRLAKKKETVEVRTSDNRDVTIKSGKVRSDRFPIVILTSNGERDFPPAFHRRCLRITMPSPDRDDLADIVKAHLGEKTVEETNFLIKQFVEKDRRDLSADQLLNAVYLVANRFKPETSGKEKLIDVFLKYLANTDDD